ncbi:MAG: hypothetical protein U0X73_05535 [Thermoanaerobaculia bacterium]
MRLWGRVFGGFLLLFAAVFAAVAIFVPHDRGASLGAAAVCALAAVVLVPWIVRTFESFTGDSRVLAEGRPGWATVVRATPTAWRYNRRDPIVRLELEVELPEARYPVTLRHRVPLERRTEARAGARLPIRADPDDRQRVFIDWSQPPQI